jgi:hypothetical protein
VKEEKKAPVPQPDEFKTKVANSGTFEIETSSLSDPVDDPVQHV